MPTTVLKLFAEQGTGWTKRRLYAFPLASIQMCWSSKNNRNFTKGI